MLDMILVKLLHGYLLLREGTFMWLTSVRHVFFSYRMAMNVLSL